MLPVYDLEARNLVAFKKPVLVRDVQPIAEGLEVRQYYGYHKYETGGIFPKKYSSALSTGIEMLYIRVGERVPISEIVALHLPKLFPKTFAYLIEEYGSERTTGKRMGTCLFRLSVDSDLVTKESIGKYFISEKIRKERLLPLVRKVQQVEQIA
jgi:hypothetical protein